MKINGVDIKSRNGDCLKQSLAFLLNIPLSAVPNFHKLPLSSWKVAFETWVQSKGFNMIESSNQPDKNHIAVYRLWDTEKDERLPLHAVVSDGKRIIFDINNPASNNKMKHVKYRDLVRCYAFELK